MMRLRVYKEGEEIQSLDWNFESKTEIVLGRAPSSDIRIQDRAVGREHLLMKHTSEHGIEFQKKSKFGKVLLNGKDSEQASLKPGDVLSIGEYQLHFLQDKPQQELLREDSPQNSIFESNTLKLEEMQQEANPPAQAEPLALNQIEQIENFQQPPLNEQPNEKTQSFQQNFQEDRTAVMQKPEQVSLKLVFPPDSANVQEITIDKQEIFIGRDESCEVIINDKKASRKHLRIYKDGLRVQAQDLDSANGTFVNGHRIQSTMLSGEDILKIGSTEFVFKALNADYFENENQFEPIYSDEAIPFQSNEEVHSNAPQESSDPKPKETPLSTLRAILKSFLPSKEGRIVERFKKQPLPRKIIILCIVFLVMFYAMDEEKVKKKKTANRDLASLSSDAAFKSLPNQKKQFVVNTYQLAFDLFKGKQYERVIYEVDKLIAVLPNGYKDSFDIKNYAVRALEIQKANEEEQRRKESEEKLRKEIAELVIQAEELVKAQKDTEAKDVFAKVLEKDPDNASILRLRQEIEEREHLKVVQEEAKRDLEFKEKQFSLILQQAKRLLKQQDYYGSIDKAEEANVLFGTDAKKSAQALALSKKARLELQGKLDPFLSAGKQALASHDWTKARDAFSKAIQIDDKNEIAKQGLETVRIQLSEVARKIYIDAIVAESVSDFTQARMKFKECLEQSVEGDLYYGRCSRKYQRLEMIGRGIASEGEAAPALSPETPGSSAYIEGKNEESVDTEAKPPEAKPEPETKEPETKESEDPDSKPEVAPDGQ